MNMSRNMIGPDHYRFIDTIDPDGVEIICITYVVTRETEHCYFVMRDHDARRAALMSPEWVKRQTKRVAKASRKRFCYPDMAEAMDSYRRRKAFQVGHAKVAAARAEAGLAAAQKLLETPKLINAAAVRCEGGDYIKQLNWGDC
ncbi:hypothetical protein A9513_033025 [Pseudomonas sp. AU12215]|nr:hypothetical protein A9513_033025 [Pseudomonas sp. AU12215]